MRRCHASRPCRKLTADAAPCCAVLSWVCRVLNLGAKGSTSTHCEADVHDAIGATWDTHDNILVAQLYNKFCHIDMRRPLDKGKKRPVEKLSIGGGDEVRRPRPQAQHTAQLRALLQGWLLSGL